MVEDKSERIHTCRSGKVRLNLFKKSGDYGAYVEPGQPVYWYKDETDNVQYSEYLRGRHMLDAAFCYVMAHWFCESWQSNRRLETFPELSPGAESGQITHKEAA